MRKKQPVRRRVKFAPSRRSGYRKRSPGLHLVKRLGPAWYVSGTYRGRKIRKCTFETDIDLAQQCMRVLMEQVDREVGVHPMFRATMSPEASLEPSPLARPLRGVKVASEPSTALPGLHGKRKRTFYEACDGYLKQRRPAASMQRAVLKVRDFYGPELLCEDFTQETLHVAFEALGSENASEATLKRQIQTPARAVLTWAAQTWGLSQGCSRPTFRKMSDGGRRDRVMTPAEAAALTSLARSKGLRMLECAMVIALCEGPRREDLFKLPWEEIDLAHGVMTLRDVKSMPGVVTNHRIDDLRPRTIRVLSELQTLTGVASGRVLRTAEGVPFKRIDTFGVAMNDGIRELAEELGLPRAEEITLHMLRHSCTSWQYVVDPDIERVRIRVGWTTTKMAFRYVHFLPRHHRAEVLEFWEVDRIDTADGKLPP